MTLIRQHSLPSHFSINTSACVLLAHFVLSGMMQHCVVLHYIISMSWCCDYQHDNPVSKLSVWVGFKNDRCDKLFYRKCCHVFIKDQDSSVVYNNLYLVYIQICIEPTVTLNQCLCNQSLFLKIKKYKYIHAYSVMQHVNQIQLN